MIGGILGLVVMLWYYRVEMLPFFDLVGAYALLAHGIARIGCFISGCCYGTVWYDGVCAVVYTHQLSLAPLDVPLFPIQIVMSIASLVGFAVCYRIYQMRGRRDGFVFGMYLLWESSARFFVDFFRGDRELYCGSLGYYQYVALLMIAATVYYLIVIVGRPSARRRW
jgi:phosphatidylglycerol:prolipoprotein diacylglycerol transferase